MASSLLRSAISRSTKLVSTIGPASTNPAVLQQLVKVADVIRFNFSHGSHDEHLQRLLSVRQLAKQANRHVAVLQDLCGPKVRTTDTIDNKLIQLLPGEEFTIVSSKEAKGDHIARRTGTNYTRLAQEIKPGDQILLSDGLIALRVKKVNGIDVVCEVLNGGALKGRQGINLPGVKMGINAVTEKDLVDLRFGLEHGVDWVAISFVRSGADVRILRKEIEAVAKERNIQSYALPKVMAKIEKPEALEALPEILDEVDGIMVARGDLGVEMLPQEVPIAQKRIVVECNRRGLPVIVATQMLESMIQAPRPTRAEVSDVCNAIFDGADACMLSAETAAGNFPVEAAQMMADIAATAAANPEVDTSLIEQNVLLQALNGKDPPQYGLGRAAVSLASALNAKAIIAFTITGRTAIGVAQHRPRIPIIAFTRSEEVARQLNLSRNIFPQIAHECNTIVELTQIAMDFVKRENIAAIGDSIVLTASHPLLHSHSPSNFIKVIDVV